MKKIFINLVFTLIFLIPVSTQAVCDCGSTDSASPCTGQFINVVVKAGTPNGGTAHDGIYNWTFNSGGGNARCGQFANGDYWVAPAIGQSTVIVTSITTTSPGTIMADEDPTLEQMGLLVNSSGIHYGNYMEIENIIPLLPLSYSGVDSLVAGLIRNQSIEGGCGTSGIVNGGCMSSYDVVTVLSEVPQNAGATVIRPNITGKTKEILTFDDFDFSRLPAKSFLAGTNAEGLENIKRRWSHSIEIFGLGSLSDGSLEIETFSEGGRAFRSHTLIDDYGGGMASTWNNDMMIIFSADNSLEEKKSALAAMFTYGLDIYHSVFDAPEGLTRYWLCGATQSPGKFMSPVFLAAFERDDAKSNNLKTVHENVNIDRLYGPLELTQMYRGKNGVLIWGDESPYGGSYITGAYWGGVLSGQCYDDAPQQLKYDYYKFSEWKTFNIPIGEFMTGVTQFTFWANPGSSGIGDLKIRNISIDGVPINFSEVTLQNYNNSTASGVIEDGGLTYSVPNGVKVEKQTQESYTINSNSMLTFDWYQSVGSSNYAIGFDEDAIYDSTKRLIQISGSWAESNMFQMGCAPSSGGKKTLEDPHQYIDGPERKPGTSYMSSSLGIQRSMAAMMLIMPKIREIINYDSLIEYVERVTYRGVESGNDPCVTPDSRENYETCDAYRNEGCMYYGVTWGPNPSNPSECIKTPTPPYNKVGRFSSLHGTPVGASYTSGQVESNWETIFSLYNNYRSDVDSSGGITTTDALLTLRNSLGLPMNGTAWQVSLNTGDVNCSGASNSADALLILRYSLGLSMEGTGWCE